ncbi:MAG: riboflavin synthase [Treponemataceae bacterium]|nr:riboflavin synthase [Treponemataceae bacterium]
MFTGIIEEIGKITGSALRGDSGSISIAARDVLDGTKIGDSIAVNGVCLTVTRITDGGFTADVMAETLRRSNLGSLRAGSAVNLERALAADGRFGGHIVSGHIDGTGTVSEFRPEGNAVWLTVAAPTEILALTVEKGSIAIDGASLTVADVGGSGFSVSLIPHTAARTTLLSKKIGGIVNLEADIIGKYVQKLLRAESPPEASGARGGCSGGITEELLKQCGF